jgi:predicted nuclease of restriction endonuclease-like RecB superfamily
MTYDEDELVAVIAAYKSGMSVEEVAKTVGISSDSKVWHMLRASSTPMRKPNYPTRREYNGISYRSRYEASFAKLLDMLGIKFTFEPVKFRIAGNSTYTPDFYLVDLDIYIELKGYEQGTQAARRAIVAKKYGISLIVLGKDELTSIGAI